MKSRWNTCASAFLLSIALTGCSQTCRQWDYQDIHGCSPAFNSGRMILSPERASIPFEIELSRSRSGLKMYINILLLQLPPLSDDPSRSSIELLVDHDRFTIYPYRFKGGQRLLLPDETTQFLIDRLYNALPFTIKIGIYESTVVPDQFPNLYQQLIDLPIQ